MFQDKIYALSDRPSVSQSYSSYLDEPVRLIRWCLFGMSGWWSSNAIFSQLPIFIGQLPAGKCLGNQLSTTLQLGNVMLITYKILEGCGFTLDVRKVIRVMMVVAFIALIVCACMWDMLIAGHEVPLLVLMSIAGSVGCVSNSLYWAYMMQYSPAATKATSVGMCLSGVVTSMMQTLQQAGCDYGKPRFSVTVNLATAAALQLVWGLAVLCTEEAKPFPRQKSPGCPKSPVPGAWRRRLSPASLSLLGDVGAPDREEDLNSVTLTRQISPWSTDSGSWPDNLSVVILNASDFLLHAAEYTVPTFLPFMVGAYSKAERPELLTRMMVVAQVGETLGRLLSPDSSGRLYYILPGFCSVSMPATFMLFFALAVRPQILSGTLSFPAATWVVPALNLWFNFCYGLLQNVLFLKARHLTESVTVAERLASTMGFVGQMGSLTANLIVCLIVNT